MIRLLRSYVFWTHERGSLHYDVMVTLILLFLFVSPHLIDFHDRPIPEVPARASEVLVSTVGSEGAEHHFVYEVRADDLHDPRSEADLAAQLTEKVRTIAGDATVSEIKPVKDPHGRVVAYDATVLR